MSHKEEISKCARLNGFQEIFSDLQKYVIPKGQKISEGNVGVPKTKGQIISECPYEIIVSPTRPTKKFRNFCPSF